MENQDNFPYLFDRNACKICDGRCCRGRAGYVWISKAELEEMAGTRKMTVPLFSRQYVRQVQGRLSLQERVINGEHFCCFFNLMDRQCTIYQSRPRQCRAFPFWEPLKKDPKTLLGQCPGVTLR